MSMLEMSDCLSGEDSALIFALRALISREISSSPLFFPSSSHVAPSLYSHSLSFLLLCSSSTTPLSQHHSALCLLSQTRVRRGQEWGYCMNHRQHKLFWPEVQLTCCQSINQPRQKTDAGETDGQGKNMTWIQHVRCLGDVQNPNF